MAALPVGAQVNRHPNGTKDFCNSFWGPGDDGVNILFSRMRGAMKTTEELKYFWNERAAIEQQYAQRLAGLAKFSLGGEEIGELRQALDTLKTETESQAAAHATLADRIRGVIEVQATALHNNQLNHKKASQTNVEKLFKQKQNQESFVNKAREKYDGDLLRINSYTQQTQYATGKDLERLQAKLKRAQQTVQANEKDYNNFTQALLDMLPGWEKQWKEFCDSCQDLEEERLELMKDNLWAYANEVSTVCVSDDQSCEQIRTVLDQMEPERDIQNFVVDYGTGNTISDPQTVAPYDMQDPTIMPTSSTMITRPADFRRVSRRTMTNAPSVGDYQPPREPVPPIPTNGHSEPIRQDSGGSIPAQARTTPPQQQAQPPQGHQRSNSRVREEDAHSMRSQQQPPTGPPPAIAPPPPPPSDPYTVPSTVSTPRRQRESQPLPTPSRDQYTAQEAPPPMPAPPPPPPAPAEPETGGILFYVKALYDYTATIEEEFDFQAGDVIAVTATPDDGWWSGELLDEQRREPGRHIFPSNFVCLF